MKDRDRLQRFLGVHKLRDGDAAMLLDVSIGDIAAVLAGEADLTARHRAIMVLYGSAHKDARASALRHLREAVHEEWRPIPGYSNYEASSRGRVRRATGGSGASALRVLKQTPMPNGYLRVTLYNDAGRMQTKQVHRVVCIAFHGLAPGMQACHRDGDHTNNAAENLYWGTAAQNAQDRVRHEAEDPMRRLRKLAERGEKPGTKLGKASVRALYSAGLINRNKALALSGK